MSTTKTNNPLVAMFKKLTPADHTATLLLILTLAQALQIALDKTGKDAIHFLLGAALLVGISLAMFWPLKVMLQPKKKAVHALISTLMLFLVLSHDNHQLWTASALLLTLYVAKFGLQYRGMAIFNPIAFSIVSVTLLSFVVPSVNDPELVWAGLQANFTVSGIVLPVSLMFMGISILGNVRRIRRIPLALSYLGTAFLLQLVLDASISWLAFATATLFMGALAVVEPRTSPVKRNQQIVYGVLAAMLYVGFAHFKLPSAAMLSLCVANLGYFAYRWRATSLRKNA
ncbi:MAG: hypothetical protein EP343_34650 [Deltaproteobacteria bacterium]|nr:MAG: hypothetical protein EP343_34650 [Deltaproteobacteria bacterium]